MSVTKYAWCAGPQRAANDAPTEVRRVRRPAACCEWHAHRSTPGAPARCMLRMTHPPKCTWYPPPGSTPAAARR